MRRVAMALAMLVLVGCGGGAGDDADADAKAYRTGYDTVTGCTPADFAFIQQLASDRIAAESGNGVGPATGLTVAELRSGRDGAEAKYRELGCMAPR